MSPDVERDTQVRYVASISKGGGMISDTKCLVQEWKPGEDVDAFAQRVHDENILGTYTAYRARDIVRRVFAPRYMRPDDRPARLLKCLVERRFPQKTFSEMLFLFCARADRLLYDFTVQVYWRAAHRGRSKLTVEDGRAFLADAESNGRIPEPWSEGTQVKISRGLLGMMRDVGFVRDRGRPTREKELVSYRISDEGVALLARELHEAGVTDADLSEHPDWRLFGLGGDQTLDRLDAVGEHRGLLVQRGGSVVRITWTVDSMEGLFDVLTGEDI